MLGARTCTQTKKRVPRFLILEALLKLREMISYGCFDHQVSKMVLLEVVIPNIDPFVSISLLIKSLLFVYDVITQNGFKIM